MHHQVPLLVLYCHILVLIITISNRFFFFCLTDEDNVKEISRFAKNFMPILFNLLIEYATDAKEDPLQVTIFETIKAYVLISDTKVRSHFFFSS